MTEQELTRAILDRLALMPDVWVWRNNTGVAKAHGHRISFGKVGSGDISGLLRGGRRLELEVKLPGGKWKTTPEQEAFGARVLELGGLWAVVRSIEEAVAIVEGATGTQRAA